MNGPEHYRAAEKLIDEAQHFDSDNAAFALRWAQVHATLALVAAQVEAEALRGWEVAR